MRAPGRRAGRTRRLLGAALMAALLLLPPVAASAADDDEDEDLRSPVRRIADQTFDAVFLRTSGLVVLVAGAGLFVPAAWVTAPGGSVPIQEALSTFVLTPANYVFTRPLGDF